MCTALLARNPRTPSASHPPEVGFCSLLSWGPWIETKVAAVEFGSYCKGATVFTAEGPILYKPGHKVAPERWCVCRREASHLAGHGVILVSRV